MRLIIFPHAGGASYSYGFLSDRFRDDIDITAVEYPGHGTRIGEPLVVNHKDLVVEIADAIAQDDIRTVIFGHSLGSLIAFETARELASAGIPVAHLFVSAAGGPSTHSQSLQRTWSDEELILKLVQYAGTPPDFLEDGDFREMLLRILRSDFRVLDNYVFEPNDRFSMGITAFYGVDDRTLSYEDVMRWGEATSAGFSVHALSGGHFYNSTSISKLCAKISETIENVVHY